MNPTEIKSILSGMGRNHANKALGQHFLLDAAALDAVVEAAGVKSGDRILEIGPGLGVLTESLLKRGVFVVAVERDRGFVEFLQKRFASEIASGQLQIQQGDAADGGWTNAFGSVSWKLAANLPYSITSLVFRLALGAVRPPDEIAVLIQREVAERAIAKGKKHSLLSLLVAFSCSEARIVRHVPPGAFWPPPKVDSSVLHLKPLSITERQSKWNDAELEDLMRVAKAGFAHPRKKLRSNLLECRLWSAVHIDTAFQALGLDGNRRAEDMLPSDWVSLYHHIKNP